MKSRIISIAVIILYFFIINNFNVLNQPGEERQPEEPEWSKAAGLKQYS